MTPVEQTLYGMTRFRIDDEVIVAGELAGTVTGIKVTTSGEDEYRVFFFDGSDTPTERWYRDSLLDEPEPDLHNVACLACAREARNATKH
jgi:hypothetical protein